MKKNTVTTAEWIELIRLLRQLPEEAKLEMYWMSEGARIVAGAERGLR